MRRTLHLSTTPPMGHTTINDPDTGQPRRVDSRQWLSITWTDIVGHPDAEQRRRHLAAGTGVDYAEGVKLTDPRRMAVYFAKYGAADAKCSAAGAEEYQHQVPREWLTSHLVCNDCGGEYEEDRDECPACGGWRPAAGARGSGGNSVSQQVGSCAGGTAPWG